MQKLILPDNSPTAQKAEEYMMALHDLLEYEHTARSSHPNIGITSA